MGGISNGRTYDTRTQHWPQLAAGTNAPGHTLTTWLPSASTCWHRRRGPVSLPSTNEDENGDATHTVSAVCARCMVESGDDGGRATVSDAVRALVRRARLKVHLPLVPPPVAAFLPTSHNTPPDHTSLLPRPTSFPSPSDVPLPNGVAAVSQDNIAGNKASETAASTTIHLTAAVGPNIANDVGEAVDVPANLAGTTDPGTPTTPFSFPEAAGRCHTS